MRAVALSLDCPLMDNYPEKRLGSTRLCQYKSGQVRSSQDGSVTSGQVRLLECSRGGNFRGREIYPHAETVREVRVRGSWPELTLLRQFLFIERHNLSAPQNDVGASFSKRRVRRSLHGPFYPIRKFMSDSREKLLTLNVPTRDATTPVAVRLWLMDKGVF